MLGVCTENCIFLVKNKEYRGFLIKLKCYMFVGRLIIIYNNNNGVYSFCNQRQSDGNAHILL